MAPVALFVKVDGHGSVYYLYVGCMKIKKGEDVNRMNAAEQYTEI